MNASPLGVIDSRYSQPEATAPAWDELAKELEAAEIYWLTTVRPDGRPHTTPLIGAFFDGVFFFGTGRGEQKEKNLAANPACVITTGCNSYFRGRDLVLEGDAEIITDSVAFATIAEHYRRKYDWDFSPDERMVVFRVAPATVFAFGKGKPFSQVKYRFTG
jgi:hypothetical protein